MLDGLQADVVTLALAADIDALAKRGLLAADWQTRLPDNASPYTSTIVFLVRKGNPKGIHDWPDLMKPDVAVITPNPKTSGGARWNFLAALAGRSASRVPPTPSAEEFMRALFHQVPVLDTGARGATTSFAQRGLGDVLLAWENEAWLARKEFGADKFEIVYPSLSILAEPPVAVVDSVVDKQGHARGRGGLSGIPLYQGGPGDRREELLPAARPRGGGAATPSAIPPLKLVTIQDFGGWDEAQATYFADGGMFDRIFTPGITVMLAGLHGASGSVAGLRPDSWRHAVWLSLIVLLPLAALVLRPWELGHRRRLALDHRAARAGRTAPELRHRGAGRGW